MLLVLLERVTHPLEDHTTSLFPERLIWCDIHIRLVFEDIEHRISEELRRCLLGDVANKHERGQPSLPFEDVSRRLDAYVERSDFARSHVESRKHKWFSLVPLCLPDDAPTIVADL